MLKSLFNSYPNKVFFYKVVLTQLSFPANIGNYLNSQSNFSLIYHIICKKTYPTISSFYYNVIQYICKTSFLKMVITQTSLLPQPKRRRCKVLMKEKKENSRKLKKNIH